MKFSSVPEDPIDPCTTEHKFVLSSKADLKVEKQISIEGIFFVVVAFLVDKSCMLQKSKQEKKS